MPRSSSLSSSRQSDAVCAAILVPGIGGSGPEKPCFVAPPAWAAPERRPLIVILWAAGQLVKVNG